MAYTEKPDKTAPQRNRACQYGGVCEGQREVGRKRKREKTVD